MTTARGAALTERHRQDQLALRALLLREILRIWPAFDVEAIDESWATLEPVLMALAERARARSSLISASYYRAFRAAEGVRAPMPTTLPPEADWRTAAQVSLRVTGPIYTKTALGRGQKDIKADALVRVAGALSRIALNAGRETMYRYGLAE